MERWRWSGILGRCQREDSKFQLDSELTESSAVVTGEFHLISA
jgi:hypothetical protein